MQTEQPDRHFLASRVKSRRIALSLSQEALAARAGFARSTLSKIENGNLSPTFELLLKLARGLGTDLAELLHTGGPSALTGRMIVTRGAPAPAVTDDNSALTPLAAELRGRKFQSYVAEFTCTDIADFGPWNSHATEDFLYVLSGDLVFVSEGYEPAVLSPGDSVHFDGAMPHACLAQPGQTCRCLYVFSDKAG
ncbi:helix-turn-helix domain-containing protein [Roseovarius arcticus]|uniref:helix-turn-helix domain-containing protein n=1 Tax=Roseovarius arcticus TaxID=2547404 RepID=UPI0014865D90|nr:XRE family transcriptional regulator [Roseovarius arcticus]